MTSIASDDNEQQLAWWGASTPPHLGPKTLAMLVSIIRECANEFDLPPEAIFSRVRTSQVALGRMAAMSLARESCPHLSSLTLGQFFMRDHGTILHAVTTIGSRRRHDPGFASRYERIRPATLGA